MEQNESNEITRKNQRWIKETIMEHNIIFKVSKNKFTSFCPLGKQNVFLKKQFYVCVCSNFNEMCFVCQFIFAAPPPLEKKK